MENILTKYLRPAFWIALFALPLSVSAQQSVLKVEKASILLEEAAQNTTSTFDFSEPDENTVTVTLNMNTTSSGEVLGVSFSNPEGNGINIGGISFRLTEDQEEEGDEPKNDVTSKHYVLSDWMKEIETGVVYVNGNTPRQIDVTYIIVDELAAKPGIDPFKYVISDNVTGGAKPDKPKFRVSSLVAFDANMKPVKVNVQVKYTIENELPDHVIKTATSAATVYPNPAQNFIYVPATAGQPTVVTVLNISGQQVYSQKLNGESIAKLDVSQLATGTYILHIQDEKGTQVERFIKTN